MVALKISVVSGRSLCVAAQWARRGAVPTSPVAIRQPYANKKDIIPTHTNRTRVMDKPHQFDAQTNKAECKIVYRTVCGKI